MKLKTGKIEIGKIDEGVTPEHLALPSRIELSDSRSLFSVFDFPVSIFEPRLLIRKS
jgi:hypothetical protein